jgi:hypothetical protein
MGQIVVQVKAVGINRWIRIRSGTHVRKPNLPYTPGTDVGGVVAAVGAEVTGFKNGDRSTPTAPSVSTPTRSMCDSAKASASGSSLSHRLRRSINRTAPRGVLFDRAAHGPEHCSCTGQRRRRHRRDAAARAYGMRDRNRQHGQGAAPCTQAHECSPTAMPATGSNHAAHRWIRRGRDPRCSPT